MTHWKWFGNAGHFCCGRWCRFHLTTKVRGYLISTVGEMVLPSASGGSEVNEEKFLSKNPLGEEVGYGRLFETMVFKSSKYCCVKGCLCGMPVIDGPEIDFDGYNTKEKATKGHMIMCKKWDK